MVAARAQARGLSPADVEGIRETLAAGRRPKVMFTEAAGQIAGQVGQVVQLADPTFFPIHFDAGWCAFVAGGWSMRQTTPEGGN